MKLIYCLIFALTSFYVQSCFLFDLSKPVSLKKCSMESTVASFWFQTTHMVLMKF
ncbi:hypothetical protein SAMN06296036_11957 [Pseudobacteriovorax antillogorgiicola]|uniref:Uncharacterized protein n=1 Tax=Pseudobacteriovorax antillogorgiicola TaxID=1513793 RepID=A0A1Y6CJ05_9BACT|nr:hypothetical protein EDD56_11956 [Pseudobacteriovorax antillogorgiicola]SMF58095.1 hypothetical protein SAMN06296036_11957 [Pseudobacteriovorax antillogorgiicola]